MRATFDLPSLVQDPRQIDDVPPKAAPELLAQLEEVRARLWVRALHPQRSQLGQNDARLPKGNDRLLTTAEAAELLSVDKRWLYSHSSTLPFTRRLSPRKLRFSERGLWRWVETCK